MFKNVAGQKLTVYAWNSVTGLPKTGDAANLTAYRSLDDGTVTVLTDTSATETDATNAKGYYLFDLSQAETNGDKIAFSAKSSTSGIVVLAVPAVVQTVPSSGVSSQASITDLGTRIPTALTPDGMMKSDMLYVNGTGQSNGDVNLKIDSVKSDTAAIKLVTNNITFTVAGAVDVNIIAWLGYVATVDGNNYPFIGSVNTKTGYALTGAYDAAKTAAQASTALSNLVWTDAKAGYLDAAVSSASAPSAAAVADAVWDEPLSGHATSGTTGAGLTAAQSAGDPWSTTVPASYGVGTAGYKFGNLATSQGIASALTNIGSVELIGPMLTGAAHKIVRGSAYLSAISTAPYVLVAKATYDLTGATAEFRMKLDRQTAVIITASIVSYDATYWKVYADLTASNTDDMTTGTGHDQFWVTLSGGAVVCLSQNYLEVIAGIGVA